MEGLTVVTFDVNLNLPGVRDYFQQALSEGQVGVFLSSLHNASGFHGGPGVGESYAKYYTKENFAVVGGFADAVTLTIDYDLVDALGDYDRNGEIELADYTKWKMDFGSAVAMAGDGADGNRNGVIDTGDYTVWRNVYERRG